MTLSTKEELLGGGFCLRFKCYGAAGGVGYMRILTNNNASMGGDMKFSSFDKAGMNENSNEINTRAMFRREVGVDDGLPSL